MPEVVVRYYAGARAAAGVDSDTVPDVASVEAALDAAVRLRAGLAKVLPACSLLLNGVAVHDTAAAVSAPSELDVLPPFAGG